ncbi:Wzz/FepE/Etk N-terminal domain-containing protein [Gammaproteobacteria bacterium]|nr:Wzz/FepE/Etk N-terminal domain-containing protein [Gammaproteobacteria bacterium]
MESDSNKNPLININNDDEIDFKELVLVIWNRKFFVLSVVTFFSIIAIIYSLALPNIYQSRALLSPMEGQGGINQTIGNYSGIASFAGINLPSQDSDSNAVKSIQKLNSLSFFSEHILPNIFLPDLMAIDSWDRDSNKILYDENIYNDSTKAWVRDFKSTQTQTPSAQEAFSIFIKDNLYVSKDMDTGFVTIAIKHQSPYIAKQWTEIIVDQLNNFFRTKDKAEAQAAVAFLNMQIAQTSFAEIKQVIAELIQQKTQQLALIEVSEFYVFEYLDPPAVMEQKSEPKRSLICILGAFIGGFLGVFIVILRHFAFKENS